MNTLQRVGTLLVLLFTMISAAWSYQGGYTVWQGDISDNSLHEILPAGSINTANNHGASLVWAIFVSDGQNEIGTSGALRYGSAESLKRFADTLELSLQPDGSLTVQRLSGILTYSITIRIMWV